MSHSTSGAATNEAETTVTFEQQVNDIAAQMVQDDKGVWQLPEDLSVSEEVAYAAKLEKRRRDTQSSLAKTSQKLEATKAKNESLVEKLKDSFAVQLTDEESEELEELKLSDPEAWREKMDEYEERASESFNQELAELGYDDEEISVMADRAVILTEFLENNPGLVLDDNVFENDLPPRLRNDLEEGKVSFEDFLVQAKEYLSRGATTAQNDEEEEEPDLGKAGGGAKASGKAIAADEAQAYENTIF